MTELAHHYELPPDLRHTYDQWVTTVESVLADDKFFHPLRLPGERALKCRSAANMLTVLAEEQGHTVDRVNVLHMNKARGVPLERSFTHGVAIVYRRALFDLTFCQFLEENSPVISSKREPHGRLLVSAHQSSHPLVIQLIAQGYIAIDDETTLTSYLDLVTSNREQSKPFKLAMLDRIRRYSPQEIYRQRIMIALGLIQPSAEYIDYIQSIGSSEPI